MFSFYLKSLLSNRVSFNHSYTEIWLKGYYSCLDGGNRFYARSENGEYGPRFDTSRITMFRDDSTSVSCAYPHEGPGVSHEILLHIKPGNSDGLLDGYLDGINIANLSGSIGGGNLPIYGIRLDYLPDWLMVADFDITNYHVAKADLQTVENGFTPRDDGKSVADSIGDSIVTKINIDSLAAKIKNDVGTAELTGVGVFASGIIFDSSIVNALKLTVDNLELSTMKINGHNTSITFLENNPLIEKAWNLSDLKDMTFKLTAEKV